MPDLPACDWADCSAERQALPGAQLFLNPLRVAAAVQHSFDVGRVSDDIAVDGKWKRARERPVSTEHRAMNPAVECERIEVSGQAIEN